MAQKSSRGSKLSYSHGGDDDQCPPDYRALWDFFAGAYADRKDNDPEWLYICDTGQRMTYREVYEKAQLVAKGLMNLGIQKGDTIFVAGLEGGHLISLFMATVSIGAVFSNAAIRQPPAENATRILLKVEPALIVLGPHLSLQSELIELLRGFQEEGFAFPSVRHILVQNVDDEIPSSMKSFENIMKMADSMTDFDLDQRKYTVSAHDPAFITLSSGSTGTPKGIVLPNSTFVTGVRFNMWMKEYFNPGESVFACIQPHQDDLLFFAFMVSTLANGSRLVQFPHTDHSVQFLRTILKIVDEERITFMFLPSFFWQLLLNNIHFNAEYDLSSLTGGILGGQPISREFRKKLLAHFPNMLVGYGQSESIGVFNMLPEHSVEEKLTYTGKLLPGFEALIVDDNEVVVPVDVPGELWTRVPAPFLYYKDQPELTAKVKRAQDGWIMTGDTATMTADGFITILGRKDDAVRLKVLNCVVYPSPVEDILGKHTAISECCVVGHQTDLIGDELVYCIIPTFKGAVTVEEVAEWSKIHMDNELWWPTRVHFFDSFPKAGARAKMDRKLITSMVAQKIAEDGKAGWTGAVTQAIHQ